WNVNVCYVKATRRAVHQLAPSEWRLYDSAQVTLTRPASDTVAIATRFAASPDKTPALQLDDMPDVAVDYTVMVPPACAVKITQQQGPVLIYGVDGRVTASTGDGTLTLSDITGRAEANTSLGDVHVQNVKGDVEARSEHGALRFDGVSGDIRAESTTGDVWIDVARRFAGEVDFHTLSGTFHSNLATFKTDLQPGDTGYVGVLRGPLADGKASSVRYEVDTESGSATVALAR
ncbi:MAG TPA: DUF4097 family beta strand repeat-containing protein, partial [Oscillatoriaceae cyanobacterium]